MVASRRRPVAILSNPRRYAAFAAASVVVSLVTGLLVLLATDVYLHQKYQSTASVNVWGYRGPTVSSKRPGETRVAVLGGSTAFGYGPDWNESFPYLLERRLNERHPASGAFVVVNLAYNNEGAHSFRFTMEDYEYLRVDVAILYEGYNDLGDRPHTAMYRRQSAVFRLTGYLPILPLILREKALAVLHDGDIGRGYRGEQAVFRPGLASRVTGGTLGAAASTVDALEKQLGRLSPDVRGDQGPMSDVDCGARWRHYCGALVDAIVWARARSIDVIVGTQPYISDAHVAQQQALTALLQTRFGSDAGVVHVNLGRAIDLGDRRLAYDGMHLNGAGNGVIADAMVEPVLDLARRVSR